MRKNLQPSYETRENTSVDAMWVRPVLFIFKKLSSVYDFSFRFNY